MKLTTCEELKKDVEKFEKYLIENHPEVPKDINKIWLSKFLKVCELDLEKSAKLLKVNLDMRSKNQDMFEYDRDFFDEKSILARNTVLFFHFPKLTKEGVLLSLHKFKDLDPKNFNVFETLKFDCMAIDIMQATATAIPEYEVAIIDGEGVAFRHLMKMMGSLWPLKLFFQFVQEAVSYHLKEIHVINVSPIVKSCYSCIKPFINKELGDSIFFHSSPQDLHGIFDLDVLPQEYGGNLGRILDLHDAYLEDIGKKSNVLKQYNFA